MSASNNGIADVLAPVFAGHPAIRFAYLFGSRATGQASAGSDVDLAIYVRNPESFSFFDKLRVHGDCCRALKRNDIDLIVVNQTRNLILLDQIVRNGTVIWRAEGAPVDDFELGVLHRAMDFVLQRHREMGI